MHIRRHHLLYFCCIIVAILIAFYMFYPPEQLRRMGMFQMVVDVEEAAEDELKKINHKIWLSMREEQQQNKNWIRFDCERIIYGDEDYLFRLLNDQNQRLKYADPEKLPMDCAAIRARNFFLENPISKTERQFPVAYARIVYQDYRFIEAEFATNYRPQNLYCFVLDSKVEKVFRERMHSLRNCFDNVIIVPKEFDVGSNGHKMGAAFMECLEELSKGKKQWNYVFTLQNHDVQLKTNEEIVQILEWLDGASDLEYDFRPTTSQERIDGLHKKFNWTLESLHLFRNETLNMQRDVKGEKLRLWLTKGAVQTSLARPFVEFLVQKLDVGKMLEQLDSLEYAGDELFFQTLITTEHLKAPNSFTHKCIDQNVTVPYVTRINIWEFDDTKKCHSKNFRHLSCVFGLEDLFHNLRTAKELFANKIMPEFDYGAVICWHEEMRRRTLLEPGLRRLNAKFYVDWPQTRFLREWQRTSGNVDLKKFNCT